MERNLVNLADQAYDVLVIGAGITGVSIAHDATLRGLNVALVEKGDFGGFTSSASSKLLHGGIRYLPKGRLHKVRESAREQAIFQNIAPQLTRWLPFLVLTKQGAFMQGAIAMKIAMILYRLMCVGLASTIMDPGKKTPKASFFSAQELLQKVPLLRQLSGITGAQELWESHMFSSERMTLAFLKSAVSNGAVIANYAEVLTLLVDGNKVFGVKVVDRLTGEEFDIQAKVIVNAAGPHVQLVNSSIPQLRLKQRINAFSKGVHLVTRQLEPKYALALTTEKKTESIVSRGGRHFFILPWRGRSLIGTTNVPFSGNLDDVRVTAKDVDDFLMDINDSLGEQVLSRDDIYYAFTGLYPLISEDVKSDTYQGTGDYQIIDHARTDGIEAVVTALGAKYTTGRFVAAKTVDLLFAKMERPAVPCTTAMTRLIDGDIEDIAEFRKNCRQRYSSLLDEETIDYLLTCYGTEIENLIALGREKDLLHKLCPDREALEVEVHYAVSCEMAMTLDDVVFRRTGLGTIGYPGEEAIKRCAHIMGELLGWGDGERQDQIALVNERYEY